jgi:ABC-type multidrug transport system fused ATPase/permease subunit
VIDAGRLVESGAHRDLVRAGGVYSRLYDIQYAPEDREAS